MESQKPKIVLYAKRSFGEKLNVTFDFIKENWKVMLKYITYFVLPLCLIQAVNFNSLMGHMYDVNSLLAASMNHNVASGISMIINSSLLIVLSLLAGIVITALIFTFFRTYMDREERLKNLHFNDMKPLFIRNLKRSFVLFLWYLLFVIILSILLVSLTLVSLYTLIITIPLFVALIFPLLLVPSAYMLEEISVWQSIKKSFRLGFATWGGIFLIVLIMSIIANVIQTVLGIPWYVTYMVRMIFFMSEGGTEATISFGYSFLQYLLMVVLLFGGYVSSIFYYVGLTFQYGHASEVVDSITIESDIDNFDKL